MARESNIKIEGGYDESLDRAERRAKGVYYTPTSIIVDMLSTLPLAGVNLEDKLLLDPCCGEGRFLIEAVKLGFKPENIYGYDIDPKATKRARESIKELTGFDARNNIRKANFLEVAQSSSRRYDFIVTNPPWGSKIAKKEQRSWGRLYGAGHSLDSSALIMFAALRSLKEGGTLSFLLPEAFFNIGSFEDVRHEILRHQVTHLRDYEKPFVRLMTRAQAITLRKSNSDVGGVECSYEWRQHTRHQSSFAKNPKQIMNFWLSDSDAAVVAAIYEHQHITLAGRAEWGMGIVTGDNPRYCRTKPRAGYIGVIRGQDIVQEGELKARVFIPKRLSRYQQSAEEGFYLAPEKIVYRFISNRLLFRLDRDCRYMLNSANALILKEDILKYGEGIAAMLSSDVMNYLFGAIFRTHKILRGDIERLPIHIDYFAQHDKFTEESYLEYLGLERGDEGDYKVKE